MTTSKMPNVRWNIFARELEDILQAHNLRLGKLDDMHIVYYPEKVSRIKRSLDAPTQFPTLNPEELERLESKVPLTPDERARLRAGLAAAAVERALMDRQDPHTALMAADDVFQVLLARLRLEPDSPLGTVRGGAGFIAGSDTDGESDSFSEALDALDRGTLALHAARGASGRARAANIAAAEREFTRALELLAQMGQPTAETERAAWLAAWDEALAGSEAVAALLLVPALVNPTRVR